MEAVVSIVVASICACIGMFIGRTRGRGTAGFWLGFFLGPIGWIIALLLPREGRRCPFCQEVISDTASVCPHCRRDLAVRRPPKRQPVGKVTIQCPDCEERYQIDRAKVGLGFHCPKCGAHFNAMPEA